MIQVLEMLDHILEMDTWSYKCQFVHKASYLISVIFHLLKKEVINTYYLGKNFRSHFIDIITLKM